MSLKTASWTILAVLAVAATVLFNYWASFQPLSTLVYAGIVLVLFGFLNLVLPFRFLGIRKRVIGALVLVAGVIVGFTALLWPAPMIRVAQHRTQLDDIMPEYQFAERHSRRIHARPEQVVEAVRQSTFGDLKSLVTLMKIRSAVARQPFDQNGAFARNKRVLHAFSMSGNALGGNDREILVFGGADLRAQRPLQARTRQEFADCRAQGSVKLAFNFFVEDAADGWSTLTTETRILTTDNATRRGMGAYWRLIVPGSGLLRRQWLDAIKTRAEASGSQS